MPAEARQSRQRPEPRQGPGQAPQSPALGCARRLARGRTASICATELHHPLAAPHMASMNATVRAPALRLAAQQHATHTAPSVSAPRLGAIHRATLARSHPICACSHPVYELYLALHDARRLDREAEHRRVRLLRTTLLAAAAGSSETVGVVGASGGLGLSPGSARPPTPTARPQEVSVRRGGGGGGRGARMQRAALASGLGVRIHGHQM